MFYKNYDALRSRVGGAGRKKIAVAAAHDKEILLTADMASARGIADFILVGDKKKIEEAKELCGIERAFEVIDEADESKASLAASELVREGAADVLMKGLVNSGLFLKAVLDGEKGLKTGRRLSHLAAFEIPSYHKLVFHTDGGMNPYPDFEGKREIVANALEALNKLGIARPKVAALAANEVVNDRIPSTVDAARLVELEKEGGLPECDIEGPVAMDVALSSEAAMHKGITSAVSGDVDLFVVPNIEAGNMVGKTLMYCAGAKMAGVVLGGRKPIVMTSRAENAEGKLNSILLAALIS
ncbi:MAG: phosphate acyltransferase [bacterium]|nr:phosphate acyltransferase [bacterium]